MKNILIAILFLTACGVEDHISTECLFPFNENLYQYSDVEKSICMIAIHKDDTIMSGKWHLLGYKYLKDSLEHCQENFFIDYCTFEDQCDYCQ